MIATLGLARDGDGDGVLCGVRCVGSGVCLCSPADFESGFRCCVVMEVEVSSDAGWVRRQLSLWPDTHALHPQSGTSNVRTRQVSRRTSLSYI